MPHHKTLRPELRSTDYFYYSVSQFTLLASTKKGTKPDFHGAMGGDEARKLYEYFFSKVQQGYAAEKVKNGVFQAMMEVALVNDGPVCYLLRIQISVVPVFPQVTRKPTIGTHINVVSIGHLGAFSHTSSTAAIECCR